MKGKHKKTLEQVFHNPVLAGIVWRDIEHLLVALGADIEEAAGSRIAIELNGVVAVFHRLHPRKETDKGAIKSLRRFLTTAEIDV